MSSEVNMSEIEEVVFVIPEAVRGEVPGEEEKAAQLVSEQLSPKPSEEMPTDTPEEDLSNTTAADTLTKEAVIVKLTEEVDVETDVFYSITCGDAKATLVWKRFVCPGINVKCVQFNSQLISPKEFVCLAGKSTLKDWKRAIRLNGTMLRKIMDSGELDFYQHSKVCSNTCRSTKIDLVGTKVSLSVDGSSELLPCTPAADLNGMALSFSESSDEASEWVTAIGEDSVTFWKAVKEAGMLDEVVQDFEKELQDVLKGLEERAGDPPLQVKDAVLLNNIVQNFGMLDLVKKVLASHKNQMDRYREQYTRSLAALEQQCDEHRKRAKELKSRSQHLNNVLMTLTPVPSPPVAKRPRLTRAVSGPAVVGVSPQQISPQQISLPLSQLSGLPLGKVLTVAGAQAGSSLGGYTLLTSPLAGSEVGTDASNLTVLQDGAAGGFVKVLGTQFQLLTLPNALQGPTALTSGLTVEALPTEQASSPVAEGPSQEELEQERHIHEGPCEEAPEQTTEAEEQPLSTTG
ncbi:glucocorticoid modulatory element-binding protein 2 isoform X2 [Eucyclogobius newberryi]